MTSSRGAGHSPNNSTATASAGRPNNSTATASAESTKNSRPLRSFNAATFSFATSPKITRLTSHRVYAAPITKAEAVRNAYQTLALNDARVTKNSPTNPDVPGNAAFAIANNTMNAANFGMVLTTPP